jgi:O-antigen/teichoic acid export membrane protein
MTAREDRSPDGLLARLAELTRAGSGSLIYNAGSLFGATLLTAALGALYWALAARFFTPGAVGVAAAAISAMVLAGQVSTVGLGTVLMGELPHHRGSERSLIYSGVGVAAAVGLAVGVAAIAIAGTFIPELDAMRDLLGVLLFGAGAAVTAAGIVLDQAFLGILRGGLQLVRNGLASIAKLAALVAIGVGVAGATRGETLFLTWVVGGLVSMALVFAVRRVTAPGPTWTVWRSPGRLPALAARHHVLNLAILAPGLLLPLVITAVLSAEANAYFYIAFLVAGFAFAGPSALATALYAVGSRDVAALTSRVRLAFWLSMAAGVALNVFMLVGAGPLLSIFGSAYAENAVTLLRLFSLGIFAVTINSLFVPIARIERRFIEGAALMVASMAIEFVFVIAGAVLGGLEGAGVGWLVGYMLGILPLAPAVYRVGVRGEVKPITSDRFGTLPAPVSGEAALPVPRPRDGMEAVPPAPSGGSPSLTFALATDAPSLERWQAACIAPLLATRGRVASWIHLGAARPEPSARSASLELVAAGDLPAGLPEPTLAAKGARRSIHADVLLDLTRAGLEAPAQERWAFAFGRNHEQDPVGAAMRQIVAGAGPTLIELRASPGGEVLRRGTIRTTPGSLSTQLDRMLLEPAVWPAQAATERVPIGPDGGGPERPQPDVRRAAAGDSRRKPGRARAVALLRLGVRVRQIQTSVDALLRHSDWTIGVVRRPVAAWLGDQPPGEVSWLPSRAGRFAADPFGIEVGDRTHVLFEDFDQRRGRGVIATASVGSAGDWSEPEIVLDTGSHASYPYTFEADGETWMIPETSDLAEVRLYRAAEFPRRWEPEAALLRDVHVSDATVIRHDDRWWMFGTSRGRGVDEALRVWHAPRLTGPWEPHALDPVKIDAASARPGGTPFVDGGTLYRPAQDCSVRYGGRLAINRVDVLDPKRFAEEPVRFVEPLAAFPDGLHTLSAAGTTTLIDGNRMRLVAEVVRHKLATRLGR